MLGSIEDVVTVREICAVAAFTCSISLIHVTHVV